MVTGLLSEADSFPNPNKLLMKAQKGNFRKLGLNTSVIISSPPDDETKALELICTVKEEKHLQTAAMLAFKTNKETVAKQSLQRAVQVSTDPQFILASARSVLDVLIMLSVCIWVLL